jgi:hypothetical protein
MSTRNISWGVKAAGTYGLQPYQLREPIVLKYGSLILLEPSGPVQALIGLLYFYMDFVQSHHRRLITVPSFRYVVKCSFTQHSQSTFRVSDCADV